MLITRVDMLKGVKNLNDSKHRPLQIKSVVKMCEYVQTMMTGH